MFRTFCRGFDLIDTRAFIDEFCALLDSFVLYIKSMRLSHGVYCVPGRGIGSWNSLLASDRSFLCFVRERRDSHLLVSSIKAQVLLFFDDQ